MTITAGWLLTRTLAAIAAAAVYVVEGRGYHRGLQ
jgi:hypothetical protein